MPSTPTTTLIRTDLAARVAGKLLELHPDQTVRCWEDAYTAVEALEPSLLGPREGRPVALVVSACTSCGYDLDETDGEHHPDCGNG